MIATPLWVGRTRRNTIIAFRQHLASRLKSGLRVIARYEHAITTNLLQCARTFRRGEWSELKLSVKEVPISDTDRLASTSCDNQRQKEFLQPTAFLGPEVFELNAHAIGIDRPNHSRG